MKVKAEVNTMYKFVAHNRCYAMGNYFGEDDWNVTEYASSLEELVPKVAKALIDSDIRVDSWYINSLEVLTYDGKSFDLDDTIIELTKSLSTFLKTIHESDEYKELEMNQNNKNRIEEKKEQERKRKKQEEEERKLLENLKKKYEQ